MLKFFSNFASSACSFGGKEQGARGKRIALHLFPSVYHSSVCIIIFCILLFVSLLPFFLPFFLLFPLPNGRVRVGLSSLYGRAGVGLFLLPHEGNFAPP